MRQNFRSFFDGDSKIKEVTKKCYRENEESLDLNGRMEQWWQVLKYRNWSQLIFLRLENCGIVDSGLLEIIKVELPILRTLWLSKNNLTFKGVQLLLQNEWLKLEYLSLNQNGISSQGFTQIMNTTKMPQISKLSICQIKMQGLQLNQGILNNVTLTLHQIELSRNMIGCSGVKLLIKIDFKYLIKLALNNSAIQNQGAKLLGKGLWPNLSMLLLADNYIRFQGFASLLLNQAFGLNVLEFKNLDVFCSTSKIALKNNKLHQTVSQISLQTLKGKFQSI